nr:MBOAT family protein [Leptospiraceae bacterium]
MAFNSLEYLGFLLGSVGVYYVLPGFLRKYILLLVSLSFYLYFSLPFTGLLLLSATSTFLLAQKIHEFKEEESSQVKYLYIGLTLLTLILVFFKYFQLLNRVAIDLFFSVDNKPLPLFSSIIAPLGISYYTFKLISYIVDCYWEKIEVEKDFINFLLYVSFFPQILSGPIQRAGSFLSQIKENNPILIANSLEIGFKLILWGLFKKLVIADRIGMFVDQIYKSPETFPGNYVLLAGYFYTIQLYTDFSGITDIAIGSASLFGIKTPQNFRFPFYASNIQEFWSRWHITLTNWLRDYIFTPLRMNFRSLGNIGMVLSIGINMILIGTWHGANYTFIVFGMIHAIYMVTSYYTLEFRNSIYKKLRFPEFLRKLIGAILLFQFISFSMIFIRAENIEKAVLFLKSLFSNSNLGVEHILIPLYLKSAFLMIILFLLIERISQKVFLYSWMYEDVADNIENSQTPSMNQT